MKRTIEIDDTLEERRQMAIDEVKEYMIEQFDAEKEEWLENDEPDDIGELDHNGRIHEIVDGCVPVYYHETESSWYLHGDQIEEAYENAGVGDNPRENNGMAGIYYYIAEKVYEWYSDKAQAVLDEWKEANAPTDES